MQFNQKFIVNTLGCKLNQYESEAISYLLSSGKYDISDEIKNTKIVIINTCTVTSKADSKSKNIIRKAKKENPDCILIVTGCLVESDIDSLKKINEIDIIIRNKDKDKILEIIEKYDNNILEKPFIFNSNIDGTFNSNPEKFSKHARAFLKIQDGCNNFCTYCKIPFVRGESRSQSVDSILNSIMNFVKNDYNEVILTGINLGSYRYKDINFIQLLKIIVNSFNDIRFRISSIEPEFITEEFLKIFQDEKICPHLHIPLQSGIDKILKLMNRKYSIDEYMKKIKLIREVRFDPFISTDLILGFPYEEDIDFINIVENIKKINFSFIHLFGFSPRKETKAYNLMPKVPERIKTERLKILKNIVRNNNFNYRKKFINKVLNVIVERKKNDFYTGKSENYIDINITTKIPLIPKKKYKIILNSIEEDMNFGELIFK